MSIPSGYRQYSLPTMGGGQQEIYNLIKGQVGSAFPDVFQSLLGTAKGNIPHFEAQEKYAQDLFNQQIAPQIANRYAGSGIGASSGMQNAIAGAGSNLAAQLQAQRTGLMQQSMRDVLGIGEHLLGMPTQQFGLVQKENPWRDLLQVLGGGLGQLGGTLGGIKLAGIV